VRTEPPFTEDQFQLLDDADWLEQTFLVNAVRQGREVAHVFAVAGFDVPIADISQEQERIRKNMGELDRNSELYRRYVQKFGEQENAVETMREQIQKLTVDEARLRTSPDEILMNLNV